ncbi:YDG/SRA domain-containing protein [Leifsonia stereocauli]|uniref:YDG/SRA domain-containing protein n=1 Tax=Leifsonia stereocauli TaxID=3134136 RepID=UPI003CC79FB2
MARYFGTPGEITVGQWFADRRQLHDAGVHRPLQAGISGTRLEGADSIVVSGGYADDVDHGEYIFYTGHGGRDQNTSRQIMDQTPASPGNAGLITSMVEGLPVRVVRGASKASPYAPDIGFRYSGLYLVTSWQLVRGQAGFQIVRFRLDRLDEQPPLLAEIAIEYDPAFATTTVVRRIRDSALSRELKRLYDDSCQMCGTQIVGFEGRPYSEGAHVRPLGRPHLGADAATNLLCLCPNHHTQLDVGGIVIRNDMVVIDSANGDEISELGWRRSHRLDPENARYHRDIWTR